MNDKVVLFGEVVEVSGEPSRVRLDNDELAVLREGAGPVLQAGYRGEFVVEGRTEDGQTVVSPARPSGNAADAAAFDLEFDRLHSAIAGHPVAGRPRAARTATSRSIQEEEIRDWVRRVDTSLVQLRKRRAKRLGESDES